MAQADPLLALRSPTEAAVAQVGLACRQPVRPDFDGFMAKLARLFDFGSARIIGRRGGLIPVGGRVTPFGTSACCWSATPPASSRR